MPAKKPGEELELNQGRQRPRVCGSHRQARAWARSESEGLPILERMSTWLDHGALGHSQD